MANPTKFHLILSERDDAQSLTIDQHVIKNSEYENLLGIKINNKMAFDSHVSDICGKASQKLHYNEIVHPIPIRLLSLSMDVS